MNKKYILVLIAGIFGILSVFFDQRCYRLEKKSSNLLKEINDAAALKQFCYTTNEHLAHVNEEISHLHSRFMDFNSNETVDINGFYNDLKSQTYDVLNDLGKQKDFVHIKADGFDELMHELRTRSTSLDTEYARDNSLFDYTIWGYEDSEIWWHVCFNKLINNSYALWGNLIKKEKEHRSEYNNIIYKRQTAIISSMISSLISIFLIIVFFKLANIQFNASKKSSSVD